MKRNRIVIFFVLVVALGILAWWLLTRSATESATAHESVAGPPTTGKDASPSPSADSAGEDEERKAVLAQIEAAFNTPIVFYGKVIDQHGDPVPHATIGYTATDKFLASGSNYQGQADASGYFEITGVKGAGLSVAVRKKGYYFIDETDRSSPTSAATFAYGMGADSYRRPAPTKENPAVFVLHKMGEPVPLIHVRESMRISKDGTPIMIDLSTGRASSSGNLRIEAWTDPPSEGRKFSWRSALSIPGGGLVERLGAFDFEAPESGYKESLEIAMPHPSEEWVPQVEREYFVKLPDGRFGRIKFRMIAGGNHYFNLESYLNPEPGNPNLEFDPNRQDEL